VDIINSTKPGSMKWFNTASDFVKTEVTTQLLQRVGKNQLNEFLLTGKATAKQNARCTEKQNNPYATTTKC